MNSKSVDFGRGDLQYAVLLPYTYISNQYYSLITMRVTAALPLIVLSTASVGNALSA